MYEGLIERLHTAADDVQDAAFLLENLSSRYEKALSDLVKKEEKQQGKWRHDDAGVPTCSVCGKDALRTLHYSFAECHIVAYYVESPYCPNCGADMRGDIYV